MPLGQPSVALTVDVNLDFGKPNLAITSFYFSFRTTKVYTYSTSGFSEIVTLANSVAHVASSIVPATPLRVVSLVLGKYPTQLNMKYEKVIKQAGFSTISYN